VSSVSAPDAPFKRVAVTGGTGFLGRHLITALLGAGFDVRALARSAPPAGQAKSAHVRWIIGSLEQPAALEALVDGADLVLHLAGLVKARRASDFMATNRDGTAKLLAAIVKKAPQARIIHVSSLAARHPHLSPYAASKQAAEQLLQEGPAADLPRLILRPPGIYGPGDIEILKLIRTARGGLLPAPISVDHRVSLIYAPDLAAFLCALAKQGTGENANLGDAAFWSGSIWEIDDQACGADGRGGYDYRDLAAILSALLRRRVRAVPVPKGLLSLIGGAGDAFSKLSGQPLIISRGKMRELAHGDWVARPLPPALADLMPRPRDFKAGLAETLAWLKRGD
jgi:nucleoside-diphosphate-sugar epimerase